MCPKRFASRQDSFCRFNPKPEGRKRATRYTAVLQLNAPISQGTNASNSVQPRQIRSRLLTSPEALNVDIISVVTVIGPMGRFPKRSCGSVLLDHEHRPGSEQFQFALVCVTCTCMQNQLRFQKSRFFDDLYCAILSVFLTVTAMSVLDRSPGQHEMVPYPGIPAGPGEKVSEA
jgi:hypothetical protein